MLDSANRGPMRLQQSRAQGPRYGGYRKAARLLGAKKCHAMMHGDDHSKNLLRIFSGTSWRGEHHRAPHRPPSWAWGPASGEAPKVLLRLSRCRCLLSSSPGLQELNRTSSTQQPVLRSTFNIDPRSGIWHQRRRCRALLPNYGTRPPQPQTTSTRLSGKTRNFC